MDSIPLPPGSQPIHALIPIIMQTQSDDVQDHVGSTGETRDNKLKPVTQAEVDRIRTEIESLTTTLPGFRKGRFLGFQPVSMDRENVNKLMENDYMVSEKADGTRFLMYIARENEVYLIDWNYKVFQVEGLTFPSLRDPSVHLSKTLLDGEMVKEKIDSNMQRFLVYDIILLSGRQVGGNEFNVRYETIKKNIIAPRETAVKSGLKPFEIKLNEFFKVDTPSITRLLSVKLDGLIFQPIKDPYTAGICYNILEWKPASQNSVEFLLKINFVEQPGIFRRKVGELFVGYQESPFATMAFTEEKDQLDGKVVEMDQLDRKMVEMDQLDGKIVECSLDDTGRWVFMRQRTDRLYPDSYNTARAVWTSIKFPVTKGYLTNVVSQLRKKPSDSSADPEKGTHPKETEESSSPAEEEFALVMETVSANSSDDTPIATPSELKDERQQSDSNEKAVVEEVIQPATATTTTPACRSGRDKAAESTPAPKPVDVSETSSGEEKPVEPPVEMATPARRESRKPRRDTPAPSKAEAISGGTSVDVPCILARTPLDRRTGRSKPHSKYTPAPSSKVTEVSDAVATPGTAKLLEQMVATVTPAPQSNKKTQAKASVTTAATEASEEDPEEKVEDTIAIVTSARRSAKKTPAKEPAPANQASNRKLKKGATPAPVEPVNGDAEAEESTPARRGAKKGTTPARGKKATPAAQNKVEKEEEVAEEEPSANEDIPAESEKTEVVNAKEAAVVPEEEEEAKPASPPARRRGRKVAEPASKSAASKPPTRRRRQAATPVSEPKLPEKEEESVPLKEQSPAVAVVRGGRRALIKKQPVPVVEAAKEESDDSEPEEEDKPTTKPDPTGRRYRKKVEPESESEEEEDAPEPVKNPPTRRGKAAYSTSKINTPVKPAARGSKRTKSRNGSTEEQEEAAEENQPTKPTAKKAKKEEKKEVQQPVVRLTRCRVPAAAMALIDSPAATASPAKPARRGKKPAGIKVSVEPEQPASAVASPSSPFKPTRGAKKPAETSRKVSVELEKPASAPESLDTPVNTTRTNKKTSVSKKEQQAIPAPAETTRNTGKKATPEEVDKPKPAPSSRRGRFNKAAQKVEEEEEEEVKKPAGRGGRKAPAKAAPPVVKQESSEEEEEVVVARPAAKSKQATPVLVEPEEKGHRDKKSASVQQPRESSIDTTVTSKKVDASPPTDQPATKRTRATKVKAVEQEAEATSLAGQPGANRANF